MNESTRIGLSAAEAAKALGISKPMMYQLLQRPDFPALRLGRKWIVSIIGLEDWLIKNSQSEGTFFQ